MTISFTARPPKQEPFTCAITTDPPHTDQRARWTDGWWADVCTRHMEIFRKNCAAAQHPGDKLWFLRSKKETPKQ